MKGSKHPANDTTINASGNESIRAVMSRVTICRRDFVKSTVALSAVTTLSGLLPFGRATAAPLPPSNGFGGIGFDSIPPVTAPVVDAVTAPSGYKVELLVSWGTYLTCEENWNGNFGWNSGDVLNPRPDNVYGHITRQQSDAVQQLAAGTVRKQQCGSTAAQWGEPPPAILRAGHHAARQWRDRCVARNNTEQQSRIPGAIMNKQLLKIPAALTAALALTMPAHAAFVADDTGFVVVENFESFDGLVTQGPVTLGGGIQVVSTINSTLGAFAVDLGDNGTWGAGNNFAGIGDLSLLPGSLDYNGAMTFNWSEGRTGVGALFSIYQAPGGTSEMLLEALSATGTVLESSTVLLNFGDPTLTDAGSFFGFLRGTSDVYGLRVSGDGFVLDDVSLAPVPLPAAMPLLLSGIAALGAVARRRRKV